MPDDIFEPFPLPPEEEILDIQGDPEYVPQSVTRLCLDCAAVGLPGALCPKHAAADDLLAALKAFVVKYDHKAAYRDQGLLRLLGQAEDAIRKVEPNWSHWA